MSTAGADPPFSPTGVGLGYGIAIAVSILVLISTIMLASYACVRVKASGAARRNRLPTTTTTTITSSEPVVLVMGLDGSIIESYPKIVVGESRRLPKPNEGPCSICLSEYQPNDSLRCIPECNHCFHSDCIDEWLRMTATCPMCRNSPAPSSANTPLATPQSELVPLAFHVRIQNVPRFTNIVVITPRKRFKVGPFQYCQS
ncbi:putative RING-H2 finger protein ATL69 isoform X1 [Ziziphus jujuba]|uniref:RING-H2 finger protein ATL69 isoform X1 n=1 Tax=Ziziphus jujuba TaxID=326968 RepID=A0ABM4AF16_ZIZJJ|nr:putative RING-H2 finger protein ATL69 isoform X1 [Ziziphus jujuba]